MSEIIPTEGQGGHALFKDPHHVREDLRTLTAALRAGWNVPDDVRRDALAVAAGIMREGDHARDRIAAVRLLVQMRKDDVEALALLDKIGRLESGEATERIELKPVTFERRD
jgi:hypothetical protein